MGKGVCDVLSVDLLLNRIVGYLPPSDFCNLGSLSRGLVEIWTQHASVLDAVWKELVTEHTEECWHRIPEFSQTGGARYRLLTLPAESPVVSQVHNGDWKTVCQTMSRVYKQGRLRNLVRQGLYSTSSDREEQAIDQIVTDSPTFWSSSGSDDKMSSEFIVIALRQPLCLVSGIALNVYKAVYQSGWPIYSPMQVKISVSIGEFKQDPEGVKENPPGTVHIGQYSVQKTDEVQKFSWAPLVAVGGYLRLELIGRTQKQEPDDRWYTVLRYVQVFGYTLDALESDIAIERAALHTSPNVHKSDPHDENIWLTTQLHIAACGQSTSEDIPGMSQGSGQVVLAQPSPAPDNEFSTLGKAVVRSALRVAPGVLQQPAVAWEDLARRDRVLGILLEDLKRDMSLACEAELTIVSLCAEMSKGQPATYDPNRLQSFVRLRDYAIDLRPNEWFRGRTEIGSAALKELRDMARGNRVQRGSDVFLSLYLANASAQYPRMLQQEFRVEPAPVDLPRALSLRDMLDPELVKDEQLVRGFKLRFIQLSDGSVSEQASRVQRLRAQDQALQYLEALLRVDQRLTERESVAYAVREVAYHNTHSTWQRLSNMLASGHLAPSATLADVLLGPLSRGNFHHLFSWMAVRVYAMAAIPHRVLTTLAALGALDSLTQSMNQYGEGSDGLVVDVLEALPGNNDVIIFAMRLLGGQVETVNREALLPQLLCWLGLKTGAGKVVRRLPLKGLSALEFNQSPGEVWVEYIARVVNLLDGMLET